MIDDDPDTEYEPDSDGSDPEDFDDEDDCPIAVEIEISKFIEAVLLLSFLVSSWLMVVVTSTQVIPRANQAGNTANLKTGRWLDTMPTISVS
jgi:hypothetical protein